MGKKRPPPEGDAAFWRGVLVGRALARDSGAPGAAPPTATLYATPPQSVFDFKVQCDDAVVAFDQALDACVPRGEQEAPPLDAFDLAVPVILSQPRALAAPSRPAQQALLQQLPAQPQDRAKRLRLSPARQGPGSEGPNPEAPGLLQQPGAAAVPAPGLAAEPQGQLLRLPAGPPNGGQLPAAPTTSGRRTRAVAVLRVASPAEAPPPAAASDPAGSQPPQQEAQSWPAGLPPAGPSAARARRTRAVAVQRLDAPAAAPQQQQQQPSQSPGPGSGSEGGSQGASQRDLVPAAAAASWTHMLLGMPGAGLGWEAPGAAAALRHLRSVQETRAGQLRFRHTAAGLDSAGIGSGAGKRAPAVVSAAKAAAQTMAAASSGDGAVASGSVEPPDPHHVETLDTDEVLVTVAVSTCLLQGQEGAGQARHGGGEMALGAPVMAEVQLPGRFTLADLRDAIPCPTDELLGSAGEALPGAYMFIGDTFYLEDRPGAGGADPTAPILAYCARMGLTVPPQLHRQPGLPAQAAGEQQRPASAGGGGGSGMEASAQAGEAGGPGAEAGEQGGAAESRPTILYKLAMSDTRLDDLKLQLGNRCLALYCHQGCCEHALAFSDVRRLHPADPQDHGSYPRLLHVARQGRDRKCGVCSGRSASRLLLGHPAAPGDPCLLCGRCSDLLTGGVQPGEQLRPGPDGSVPGWRLLALFDELGG